MVWGNDDIVGMVGAGAGAALGGPIGAALGSAAGSFFGGLFGGKKSKDAGMEEYAHDIDEGAFHLGDYWTNRYGHKATGAQYRQGASTSAARIDTQPQGQVRTQQMELMDQLAARARGEGAPTQAELLLREGGDRNVAQAMAMAKSQAGLPPALALRAAEEASTQSNIATNQQVGQMRAQEQAAAEGMYAQMMEGVRGQDIGLATSQAGFQQQTNLANLQATMQQRQMNDQMTQFYEQQGFARDQAQMMANMAMEELNVQQQTAIMQAEAGIKGAEMQASASKTGGFLGMLGTIGGGLALGLAMSDKNEKKKIKKTKKELDEFMNGLAAYEYEYKNEKNGKGKHTSVMAQDLEKSNIGKQMVKEVDGKKMVDYSQGMAAMLAGVARLNERIKKLEGDK